MLGHDEATFFVADHSGSVVSVAPELGAERFVNTSERQLLGSKHSGSGRGLKRSISPPADDRGNWWAGVIEQLEQGRLSEQRRRLVSSR